MADDEQSLPAQAGMRERSTDEGIDVLLASALRGDVQAQYLDWRTHSTGHLLTRTDFHGIAGLLHAALHDQPSVPEAFRAALRDRSVSQAFWEASHARLLAQVLPKLRSAGIPALVFKGTALAYTQYSDPATRMRGDSDLLVAQDKFQQACDILGDFGFSMPLTAGGGVIRAQKPFSYTDRIGLAHDIDLHARISNSAVLARLFDFNDLERRSTALPGLGDGAHGPGPVDALLIASLHRMVHLQSPYFVNDLVYRSANRLIWLFDIHLLAQSFTAEDWRDLEQSATAKELASVCADSLRQVQIALGTKLPAGVITRLEAMENREIPKAYLTSGAAGRIVRNFRAQRGLRNRAKFLVELFFPPADHIRARYGTGRFRWLPWLYAVRVFGKLRREFRSKDAPRS